MADEGLTLGEIGRTLERHDEDIAAAATKDALAEFKGEVREKFKQVEATSIERRNALAGQIKDLKKQVDGHESGRTAKAANWIAFSLLLLTAIGLLVTIAGHGGK